MSAVDIAHSKRQSSEQHLRGADADWGALYGDAHTGATWRSNE